VLVRRLPYPPAAEVAPQGYPGKKDGEDGGDGQGRRAEDEHYLPHPHDLVDEGKEVYKEYGDEQKGRARRLFGLLGHGSKLCKDNSTLIKLPEKPIEEW
jgi:hypothetical protein